MIALASSEAEETQFTPSLLEAPREGKQRPRYSIETIRALKSELKRSDELFFLIGIDAFVDIAKWHKSEELLRECEFVVVSRPGFSLSQAADALPAALRPRTIISRGPRGTVRTLRTKGATIHLLEGVSVPISATELRADLRKRRVAPHASFWRKLLPESVADYIQKLHLYEVE